MSRLVSLVVTAALLTGCGGGGDDEAAGTAGDASTPSGTTTSSAPEASGAPHWLDGVEPATGERVRTDAFSMNVPEHFTVVSELTNGALYDGPGKVSLSIFATKSEPKTLQQVRREALQRYASAFVGTPRPRPDVEVDGQTMVRFGSVRSPLGYRNELFIVTRAGYAVEINFSKFHPDTDLEPIVKASLASLEWT